MIWYVNTIIPTFEKYFQLQPQCGLIVTIDIEQCMMLRIDSHHFSIIANSISRANLGNELHLKFKYIQHKLKELVKSISELQQLPQISTLHYVKIPRYSND